MSLTPTDCSSSLKEEENNDDCDDSDFIDDDDSSSLFSADDDDDSDGSGSEDEFEQGYSVKEASNIVANDLENGRCYDYEAAVLTTSKEEGPSVAPSTTVKDDKAMVEVLREPEVVFLESKADHQRSCESGGTKSKRSSRALVKWPIPEASTLRHMKDEDLDRIIAITSAEIRRRRRKSRTRKKKKKPLTFRRAIRKLKRGFRKNWTHKNTASAVMGVLTMGLGIFILWIFISMIGK